LGVRGYPRRGDSRIALCSPGLRARWLNQDNAMTVQQNAAGGLGVSPILLIIPKIGGQRVGMNQDNTMTVQRNAAGGLGVSPILSISPQDWGLGG